MRCFSRRVAALVVVLAYAATVAIAGPGPSPTKAKSAPSAGNAPLSPPVRLPIIGSGGSPPHELPPLEPDPRIWRPL